MRTSVGHFTYCAVEYEAVSFLAITIAVFPLVFFKLPMVSSSLPACRNIIFKKELVKQIHVKRYST